MQNSLNIAILTKTFNVQKLLLIVFITFSINFFFGQNIEKIENELKEKPENRIQNAAILRKHYSAFATDSLFNLGSFLIQEGIKDGNSAEIMYGKLVLSSFYNLTGKTDISIRNLNDCIIYYKKKGNIERLADAQNLLGIAYIYAGKYNNAANSLIKSIKNSEKLDESTESFIAQLNLSEVYIREEKLDLAEVEALSFIEKCKRINANNGLKKGYDCLAKINMQRNNIDLGIYYYEKALKLAMKDKSILGRASAFNNIAIAHFATDKLDLSFQYFKKALELRIKLGRPQEIAESYYNLGDWNFFQEKYDEALSYYQLSLNKAQENNLNREIADALDKISMCYESKGEYKLSLEYARKYQEVEAENYKRNRTNEFDLQRIMYEIDREEQSSKQKKREDKIENNVQIAQDRTKTILVSFGIIIALVVAFYFFQLNRKKANAA